MEIEVRPARRMKLEDFADLHGLKMRVAERTWTDLHPSLDFEPNRWYAFFANTDVKDGAMLCGTHGNGATQHKAIRDYAKKISGVCLVVGAFTPERREIYTPELL